MKNGLCLLFLEKVLKLEKTIYLNRIKKKAGKSLILPNIFKVVSLAVQTNL